MEPCESKVGFYAGERADLVLEVEACGAYVRWHDGLRRAGVALLLEEKSSSNDAQFRHGRERGLVRVRWNVCGCRKFDRRARLRERVASRGRQVARRRAVECSRLRECAASRRGAFCLGDISCNRPFFARSNGARERADVVHAYFVKGLSQAAYEMSRFAIDGLAHGFERRGYDEREGDAVRAAESSQFRGIFARYAEK